MPDDSATQSGSPRSDDRGEELQQEISRRADAIERAYELMLAYAAQGVPSDRESPSGPPLREALAQFDAALTGLADVYRAAASAAPADQRAAYEAFLEVLEHDARAAQAALRVILVQPSIASQHVDNLNASIHVRALLTDMFLIDEVL